MNPPTPIRDDLALKLYDRLDNLGVDELELFIAVLEKAATSINPDDLSEDDLISLMDQIDTPKTPTITEVISDLNDTELEELTQVAQLPTDKYLAQAELLMRQGQLVEPKTTDKWPIDYSKVYAWRQYELMRYNQDPSYFEQRKAFYGSGVDGCIAFVNHWIDTHDPRNAGLRDSNGNRLPVSLPLVLFPRQEQFIRFIFACMEAEADGLIEKSRDMGATWVALSASIWMWLFWDAVTVGWGSATAVKLDRSGDAGSIFYKIRDTVRGLPPVFKPAGLIPKVHLLDKRVSNPQNGAGIVGEVGDEVGRGSRTRVYFVDEAAHFEHPEAVTAALSDTTRVRIDISSVSGLGTVFHRMRMGGVVWEQGQEVVRTKTNVFIMDWRHHPAKTKDWYDTRQAKFESEGLGHIFAQEVDRDYAAALQGTIIPKKWLEACVDAHLKVGDRGDWEEGAWIAGQDVADGGVDTNAFVARKGWVFKSAQQWGERDTAVTTRRMLKHAQELPSLVLKLPHEKLSAHARLNVDSGISNVVINYDAVGVGAGLKAEANRLKDDGAMPAGITLVPWHAGGKVQWPGKNIIPDDKASPRNKDYFANLKAQAWWDLRMRVYRTFRAVTVGELLPVHELVSFDSVAIGQWLYKMIEELAQPTAQPDTRMRLVVDKTPDGAKSPNFGDATVMCAFPLSDKGSDGFKSLSRPLLVNAGEACLECGHRPVHELGVGRYQCHACGHIGDRDEGTVDRRARGLPPQHVRTPATSAGAAAPRQEGRKANTSSRYAVGSRLLRRS